MAYRGDIYISVIIPTRNRYSLLKETINSITVQTLDNNLFEVIVIDNGSNDLTINIFEEFYNKIRNFTYIFCSEPGLHVGRNIGFAESKGRVLVYCDDDIEANPNWLSTIMNSFIQDNNLGVLGGNNYPKFLATPPNWLVEMWNTSIPFSANKILPELSLLKLKYKNLTNVDPGLIWGCNFSILKEIVSKVGGFNPDGMPLNLKLFRGNGESDMALKANELGYKTMFHPLCSVYHKVTEERMTFNYFQERSYLIGVSASYSSLRNGLNPTEINKKSNYNIKDVVKSCIVSLYLKLFQSIDVKNIRINNLKFFKMGFSVHQDQYQSSSELKDWVHKKSYISNYKYEVFKSKN